MFLAFLGRILILYFSLNGIVKFSRIRLNDPQHTGFTSGLERIILGVAQPS